MGSFTRRLLLALPLAMLPGCGLLGGDKPPPPMEIEIKPPPADAKIDLLATASPLLNPGPSGVPSPIVLRLYFLSAEGPFTEANFFELWENDESTLGPTLLGKHELFLAPSDVQRISAALPPDALMVAVTAGFRDFEAAKWRAIIPLQGEKTLKLRAELKTDSVTLGPQT